MPLPRVPPRLAGCSWKATTPSDYVPAEGPTEAWIIAIPNPVPAGRGPGKTIVNWYTGDGSPGQVYVSIGGGPEQLFSSNPISSGGSHQQQGRVRVPALRRDRPYDAARRPSRSLATNRIRGPRCRIASARPRERETAR